jgi:superfamily II DNA or RNA helicase
MFKKKHKAITVGACAVLPYDQKLEDKYTLVTRYDEPFKMYRVLGDEQHKRILLPRNTATITPENDRRVVGLKVNFSANFIPRSPEQARVVMETEERLSQGRSFLISAPTGFGKSVIGCKAIADVGRKTIIVVTKEDLKDSWMQHLQSVLGLKSSEIGQLQGDICEVKGKKVVVAMIQSISKLGKYSSTLFSDFGLAIFDECLHPNHEVLTKDGWVSIDRINKGDNVMAFNSQTNSLQFEVVSRTVSKPFVGDLIHLDGRHIQIMGTPNHEQPITRKRVNGYEVDRVTLGNLSTKSKIKMPVAGFIVGSYKLSDVDRLRVAFEADGTLLYKSKDHYQYRFSFRRIRKVERLEKLLSAIGLDYKKVKNKRGDTNITFNSTIKLTKDFNWFDPYKSAKANSQFLHELQQWDGTVKVGEWEHTDISVVEKVQLIATLSGKPCNINKVQKGRYRVHWRDDTVWLCPKSVSKKQIPYDGLVHCVTVPSGNILTRLNGVLSITGNCHLVAADVFSNACFLIPAKIRIGYSATPERKDGKTIVLNAHIGEVEVVTEQFTMIPKIIVKYSGVVLPMVKVEKNGYIVEKQLPHSPGRIATVSKWLSQHPDRNRAIVDFIKMAHKKGRNVLVLSDIKQHLYNLHALCLTAGIPEVDMAYYIGGLTKAEREKAMIKPVMLGTYHYVSTGTNIPWLDTLVMATPRSDVIQIVGRIVREYMNKRHPVVYDVVDLDSNVLKGYYASRRQWYREIGCEIVRVK